MSVHTREYCKWYWKLRVLRYKCSVSCLFYFKTVLQVRLSHFDSELDNTKKELSALKVSFNKNEVRVDTLVPIEKRTLSESLACVEMSRKVKMVAENIFFTCFISSRYYIYYLLLLL